MKKTLTNVAISLVNMCNEEYGIDSAHIEVLHVSSLMMNQKLEQIERIYHVVNAFERFSCCATDLQPTTHSDLFLRSEQLPPNSPAPLA